MNKLGIIIPLVVVGLTMASTYFLIIAPKHYQPKVDDQIIMTILDEGTNQNQNIQTQYEETNPNKIYLERTVNCIEAEKEEQTIGFMNTIELRVSDVNFTDTIGDGTGDDLIIITIINVGTMDAEIVQVKFNEIKQIDNWKLTSGEDNITAGSINNLIQLTADWTAGNKYSITFNATDGTQVGYFTITA